MGLLIIIQTPLIYLICHELIKPIDIINTCNKIKIRYERANHLKEWDAKPET